jgi:hypothetical protein
MPLCDRYAFGTILGRQIENRRDVVATDFKFPKGFKVWPSTGTCDHGSVP